jgi:hypothetical protein
VSSLFSVGRKRLIFASIRTALRDAAYLYAPAHFALRDASRRVPLPYAPLKRARPAARDVDDALAVMDAAIPPIPGVNAQGLTTTHSDHGYSEWLLEKAWLDAFLGEHRESYRTLSKLRRQSLN